MKKLGILIAVLAAVVLATEVETWYEANGAWVTQGVGNPMALARCWAQFPVGGDCNKQWWHIDVFTRASMAQWIEWTLSGTEWKWKIRKVGPEPCMLDGYYAADCITTTLKSNYDVEITFSGFQDLYNANSIDQYIEVFYALSELNNPPPRTSTDWVAAAALNDVVLYVEDSQDLHDGISMKLWNYIHVTNCNSACEYVDPDGAQIHIELQMIKDWIDPETGYFRTT